MLAYQDMEYIEQVSRRSVLRPGRIFLLVMPRRRHAQHDSLVHQPAPMLQASTAAHSTDRQQACGCADRL